MLKARRGRRWRIRELWPPGLASPAGSLLPQYNDGSLVTHCPCLAMSWVEHGRSARKSFTKVCFSVAKPNERYGSQEPQPNLAEGLFTLSVALHAAVSKRESETSCRQVAQNASTTVAATAARDQPVAPDQMRTGHPLMPDGAALRLWWSTGITSSQVRNGAHALRPHDNDSAAHVPTA